VRDPSNMHSRHRSGHHPDGYSAESNGLKFCRRRQTGPSRQLAPASSDAEIVLSALRPPAAQAGNVVRQALLDRLSEEAAAKVVVVVAPAGWGKTCMLRDWSTSGDASSKAWLSVEPGDNDPTRFWAGVIAALNIAAPGVGSAALQMLMAPRANAAQSVVPSVLNDLARLPKRITLIIDDFQLITNESTHASFSFFAEHLPATVGLVLASRSDPPLPLARLRARGELAEIRAHDMRLTAIEIRELLAGTFGLALTAADVDVLEQRTEGWAAGVYMAGSSLRGDEDLGRVIRTLAGEDRQIMDYFAAEVLAEQPAEVRSLLLRTSVLDRMTGPLCDAVTGFDESQATLERLERSQQFLVPLDSTRHWYRYHTLFADVLRRELDNSEPGLAPSLHRRASAWHRSQGLIADAISHAISAGDLADARDLLASHWNLLLHQGLSDTVDSLLNRLPVGMVLEDARMCLIRGYVACWLGHLDEVEPWLVAAEAAKPCGPLRDGLNSVESGAGFLSADYCHMTGDLRGAEAASVRSMELQVPSNPWWRVMALTTRGVNLFWRGLDADARALFQQVVAPTQLPVNEVCRCWAEGCLAAIALREGDVESTERHLQKAENLAARHRLGSYWMTATATVTSADLLTSRGKLAEAKQVAGSALECAQRGPARLETISALLCLARISLQAGSVDDACMHISEAKHLMTKCVDAGVLSELITETARLADQAASTDGRAFRSDGLSPREAQVLELVAGGDTNKEIATELVVSVHTVERHLQNAYRKIGVRNRSDAAAYVVRREALATTQMG
jgi:LuxR family transcriptional regulator, maltose regulon positive regulatory protein